MTAGPSYTCPRCGRTSYHPADAAQGYCGHCRDWTGTHRVRLRLYIGGVVAAEDWAGLDDDACEAADAAGRLLAQRHIPAALRAEDAGELWYVELWDPSLPAPVGYLHFGSDEERIREAMMSLVLADPGAFAAALADLLDDDGRPPA